MNKKKNLRPNKGKPVVAAPGKAVEAYVPSAAAFVRASGLAEDARNRGSSEKTRAVESITKKSSDREMRAMFDMPD
eukprot:8005125-Pyramimonas_sp.AAC.1